MIIPSIYEAAPSIDVYIDSWDTTEVMNKGLAVLKSVNVIILNEVHERSLKTDIVLFLMMKALKLYPKLSLVILSAVVDTKDLLVYFNFANATLVRLEETLSYETSVSTTNVSISTFRNQVYHIALKVLVDKKDVLIILPDEEEVSQVATFLQKSNSRKLIDCEIHSLLASFPQSSQEAIIASSKKAQRPRAIVATKFAETLNLKDINWVIDSGMQAVRHYNTVLHVEKLCLEPIARSVATYRAGLVGCRTQGHCARMYIPEAVAMMMPRCAQAIGHSRLDDFILKLLVCEPGAHIEKMSLITNPSRQSLHEAYYDLEKLGLIDQERRPTALGRFLSRLGCSSEVGLLLYHALQKNAALDTMEKKLTMAFYIGMAGAMSLERPWKLYRACLSSLDNKDCRLAEFSLQTGSMGDMFSLGLGALWCLDQKRDFWPLELEGVQPEQDILALSGNVQQILSRLSAMGLNVRALAGYTGEDIDSMPDDWFNDHVQPLVEAFRLKVAYHL